MEDSRKVTVLTTVYNGLPYLESAIDSTLAQTYSDFEYMIIDDASPDDSVAKFIESYEDPRINFIKNDKNLGVSATINKALSMINTTYVVRLDQDDISLPNRVEEQIAYLENNQDVSIVCSWEHTIDSEGNRIRDWTRKLDNYGEFLAPITLGICPIWHPSIAFRTKDMIDAGGFRKEYVRAEDFEVTARLAVRRYGAAVIPKFHLLQRQHLQSQSKEYEYEQQDMSSRIQQEAIENFIKKSEAVVLTSFLRIGNDRDQKLNKDLILRNHRILQSFFQSVQKKQKLNSLEYRSFKKMIYSRIGLGVFLVDFYKFLPKRLFMCIFYTLSPLYLKIVYEFSSGLYNSMQNIKSKLRITRK